MLRLLKTNCGQGAFVQYSTTFFLVVAMITAMGVYLRRTIQARIYQATSYSFEEVRRVHRDPQNEIPGVLWAQYEPYYLNSVTLRSASQALITEIKPGGKDGYVEYTLPGGGNLSTSETVRTQATSEQAD